MLCIRFPNWPIQSLQQRLHSEGECQPLLALHTAAPGSSDRVAPGMASDVEADWKSLRAIFPTASIGPTIVAVSRDAWLAGVRPGMPLAEAMARAAELLEMAVARSISRFPRTRGAP